MGDTESETEYHTDEESSDDEAFSFDNLPAKQAGRQPQAAPALPPPPSDDLKKQIQTHRQAHGGVDKDEGEDEEDEESGDEFQDVEPEPEPEPEPVPAPPPAVLTKAPAVSHVKSAPQVPPQVPPQAPVPQVNVPTPTHVVQQRQPQQPQTPQSSAAPTPVQSVPTPESVKPNDHQHQRMPRRSASAPRPKLAIGDLMNKLFMVASSGGGQSARISDLVVAIRTSGHVRDLKQSVELTEEEGAFLMFANTLNIDDTQIIEYSEFMRMEIFSDREGEDDEEETADSTSSSSTPPRRRPQRVVTPARGSVRHSPSKTRTPPSSARGRLGPPRVAGLARPAVKTHPRTVTSMSAIRTAQSDAKKRALRMMRRTEQEATQRVEEIQKREKRASAARRSTPSQISEKLANYERAVSASIQPERSPSPQSTRRVLLSPQPDVETDTFLSLLRDRLSPPAAESLETPLTGATTEVICLQTFISQQRDTIQSLEDKLSSSDVIIRRLEKREQKALKRERRAVAQQTHLENKLLQMSNPEVLKRLLGKQEDLNGSIEHSSSQLETPTKQLTPVVTPIAAVTPQIPQPQPEVMTVHVPTGITESDVAKRISEALKPYKDKIAALKAKHSEAEAKLTSRVQELQTQADTATKQSQERATELEGKAKRIKELETHIKKQHKMVTDSETELRNAIAERDAVRTEHAKLQTSLRQPEQPEQQCSVCGATGTRLEKRKSGALKCKKCIGKRRDK